MAKPREADALARFQTLDIGADCVDPADNFVARDDRRQQVGELAVEDVQIGAANAAGGNADTDFAGSGMPVRQFGPFKSGPGGLQHHRLHGRR
jgi:hypothetical protein